MSTRLTLILLLLALVTFGCRGFFEQGTQDDVDAAEDQSFELPATAIELEPEMTALAIGRTIQLQMRLLDANEEEVTPIAPVVWASSDESVATVTDGGLVAGIEVGSAVVTVTTGEFSATSQIQVVLVAVGEVRVMPDALAIEVGRTGQFTASTFDENGNALTDRAVSWVSSDNSVATVDSEGLVTGIIVGEVTVTASSESIESVVTVTVNPRTVDGVRVEPAEVSLVEGDNATLVAEVLDSEGEAIPDSDITWSTSDEGVATVNEDGQVTAVAPGNATITATSQEASANAAVTVRARVTTVTVAPDAVTDDIGQTATLTATPLDARDDAVAGRTVNWSTQNAEVATVEGGTVTITGEGQTEVRATVDGIVGASTITGLGPVATINVDPSPAAVVVGNTVSLTVTLEDSSGRTVQRAISYESQDTDIATVNGQGVITGVMAGDTTVTVTSEEQNQVVTVNVSEE